jgi:ornithine cyclodeaminase/alanine dehydrogenase-like protein (mu-crystallin family)
VVSGKTVARPAADAITLFCLTGLAGTEVLVGDALLKEWKRRQRA